MPTSHPPLNVVSFGPRAFCKALHAALHRLDWQVRIVYGHDWLTHSAVATAEPLIVAVGAAAYPRQQLLARLQRQQIAPALAVVADHRTEWDRELLAHCRDFLRWPCRREELALRLTRSCGEASVATAALDKAHQLLEEVAHLQLIGQSPAFRETLAFIHKLAGYGAPVFIEGETGTGKEMAARAIHYLGQRREYPFVPVNCGAVPDQLLENELFGHERGAYTDAKEAQAGLVAQAHRGTLFLYMLRVILHPF